MLEQCVITGLPIVGSFHPNASGHADGDTTAFQDFINAASSRTPQGFPANRGPSAGPHARLAVASASSTSSASAAGTPAVGVAALSVTPVSVGQSSCEGTAQAGQLLQVSGSGFAPTASVGTFVSSTGLGATSEQRVGQITADTSGAISRTIRVPLAAKGFTSVGASASLISLDAIGIGATAAHLDDLTLLGLAPHGSASGTVDALPFQSFAPRYTTRRPSMECSPGSAVPVTFTLPGTAAALRDALAAGYPQSAPVSCTSLTAIGAPSATAAADVPSTSVTENENYVWKTDRSWSGCRLLDVGLVDGSSHVAMFDFEPSSLQGAAARESTSICE